MLCVANIENRERKREKERNKHQQRQLRLCYKQDYGRKDAAQSYESGFVVVTLRAGCESTTQDNEKRLRTKHDTTRAFNDDTQRKTFGGARSFVCFRGDNDNDDDDDDEASIVVVVVAVVVAVVAVV